MLGEWVSVIFCSCLSWLALAAGAARRSSINRLTWPVLPCRVRMPCGTRVLVLTQTSLATRTIPTPATLAS